MSKAKTHEELVKRYHEHRSRGDMALAGACLADDFSFTSPLMSLTSVTEHVAALTAFQQMVVGYDMISELYGDAEAILVYDLRTATPVGSQRTAEHFRLTGDKISSIMMIFDATNWRPLMGALARDR